MANNEGESDLEALARRIQFMCDSLEARNITSRIAQEFLWLAIYECYEKEVETDVPVK